MKEDKTEPRNNKGETELRVDEGEIELELRDDEGEIELELWNGKTEI